MFHEALLLLRRAGREKARTLQARLFLFFLLFAVALVGAGFLILTLAGVFNAAADRHITWLDTESEHLQANVSGDFNELSLRGAALAGTISSNISRWAERNGITESEITKGVPALTDSLSRRELIENLLSEQAGILLSTLNNNVCSGVFIILDDAVHLSGDNPSGTRAGIYFKRTATSNVSALSSKIYCLRGPAPIARANKTELLGQWRAEYTASDIEFFGTALDAARQNSGTDISRLYYWSERYLLEDDSEHCVRLCVPLIARDGTVYGLCGLEVSAMLFKNLYSPSRAEYPRVFAALAPLVQGGFDTGAGLLAGNSYLASRTNGLFRAEAQRNGGVTWYADDGMTYTGRVEQLTLYPAASPFADKAWALAILMPETDWKTVTRQSNIIFYGTIAALLAASLLAAVFISRRYIRPVVSALELLKTDSRAKLPKTRIAEIDDLLEYLSALDEQRKILDEQNVNLAAELEDAKRGTTGPVAAYKQFRRNLETLTITEHAVFNLYMKNLSAQQIADKLFVSINTIKFHNRNIYSKLDISSLKELKIYVGMMKESSIELFDN